MSCEGVRKSTCEGRTQFRFKRKIVSYIKGQGFVCLQNGIYNERQLKNLFFVLNVPQAEKGSIRNRRTYIIHALTEN